MPLAISFHILVGEWDGSSCMALCDVLTSLTICLLLGKVSVQVVACFGEVTNKQGRMRMEHPLAEG